MHISGKFDKSVYILILNYNSADETMVCVKSLIENIKYKNYKIIVLDNDSTDGSYEEIDKQIQELKKLYDVSISLIENGTNKGYAHGNNIGIKKALKEGVDYICVMNPDVIVVEDFLSELLYQIEQDDSIGMICPAGVNENTRDYCRGAGSKIGILTGYTKILNSGVKLSDINPKIYECDYLGGMCILVRASVIKEIGLIPEEYFLFYEETEWCTKCIRAGYKCVADANTKVVHKGSVTIDRASTGRISLHDYYLYRNRVVFQKRNRSFRVYVLFLLYYFAEITYARMRNRYSKHAWIAYFDGISGKDRLNRYAG